jgi:hypothetical protein
LEAPTAFNSPLHGFGCLLRRGTFRGLLGFFSLLFLRRVLLAKGFQV